MPDNPDYSKYLPGSVRFSLQDMGELAGRLGSPVTYDRRGETIFYDLFTNGLGVWQQSTSDVNSTVTLSADNLFRWAFTAKLTAGVTANSYAILSKVIGSVGTDKLAVEFVIALTTSYKQLLVSLSGVKDGISNEGFIKITPATGILAVKDENNVYQPVATIGNIAFGNATHIPVKLVVDFGTHKYVRLIIADVEYDLSQFEMYTEASGSFQYISTSIQLNSNTGVISTGYVAQCVITVNEP